MSATLTYAKNKSSGKVEHIGQVNKAADEIYECCDCGATLTVVKSAARKKDWHFRHKDAVDIAKCQATSLHDFAVSVILDNTAIVISRNMRIEYSNPRKEVSVFSTKRSDVTVEYGNGDVHFEVFVTHDLGQEKTDLYREGRIPCIKVDLSAPWWLSASAEEVIDAVLLSYDNKEKIYWPEEPVAKPIRPSDIEKAVIAVVLILLAYFVFFRRRKSWY